MGTPPTPAENISKDRGDFVIEAGTEGIPRTTERVYVEETKITVRGSRRRTTVPAKIFHKLNMTENTMLRWILHDDGTIDVEVTK